MHGGDASSGFALAFLLRGGGGLLDEAPPPHWPVPFAFPRALSFHVCVKKCGCARAPGQPARLSQIDRACPRPNHIPCIPPRLSGYRESRVSDSRRFPLPWRERLGVRVLFMAGKCAFMGGSGHSAMNGHSAMKG